MIERKDNPCRRFNVYCGDCRDLILNVPSDSIDLIILDPPYKTTSEKWDKNDEFVSFAFIEQLKRVMEDSASLYLWCGIGEKSQSLIRWFSLFAEILHFKDIITWKKRRGIGMRKGWLYTREEILWFVKDNKRFVWNEDAQYSDESNQFKVGMGGYECKSKFKRLTNVWTDIPEILGNKKSFHYTPKPIKVLERIIKVHTKVNDIVLDPCFGSGSTGYSALRLGRYFVGFEIDREFYNESIPMFSEAQKVWYAG